MKAIFLIPLFTALLFVSCEKENSEPVEPFDPHPSTLHSGFLKGTVSDSVTNAPVSGYVVRFGVNQGMDTLGADGTYFVPYQWYTGGYANPYGNSHPDHITLVLLDLSGNDATHLIKWDQGLMSFSDGDTMTADYLY